MTHKRYEPSVIEPKWQSYWEKEQTFHTPDPASEKTYILGMFPYPSGAGLHVGHVRIYTATDVLARFYRMQGHEVLFPMGWDAFGLPTENYAIKTGIKPQIATKQNIATFKAQMQALGLSYDWTREVDTTAPNYYKWTQWLFQQLYKEGLVHRRFMPINWCPKCKTGLADEEVLSDGTHERCGSVVEKREMPQWVIKITAYAEELLRDLEGLDWPEGILEMQRNWIGKSEGTEVNFDVILSNTSNTIDVVKVFTTRVDTLFGVTALVLSPEHALLKKLADVRLREELGIPEETYHSLLKYIESSKHKSELERTQLAKEKSGVFTGLYALHPLTKEKLPLWVGDYVLGWYGYGAVMLVPAHDARDFAFAKQFALPIKQVIGAENKDLPVLDYGTLENSGKYDGMSSQEAIQKLTKDLESDQKGSSMTTYKLRDWIFSRQRYWGEPFPLIYCTNCGDENGVVLVPEEELPVRLPEVDRYEPTDTGESPLVKITEWANVRCPVCGGKAKRETDTMPNWAGSSWYFLSFARAKELLDSMHPSLSNWEETFASSREWMPVDWYLGGAEHAVLHLLYARFWQKVFYKRGLVAHPEPFKRLRRVGMVGGPDGRKMSKSLGNVINPDDVVCEYGADTLRVYEMFMGPWSQDLPWDTKGVYGAYRFLKRVWDLQEKLDKQQMMDKTDLLKLNMTIQKVTEDTKELKFNTAIAAMMEWLNFLAKKPKLSTKEYEVLILLLASYAPHLSEELWHEVLCHVDSLAKAAWPQVDPKYLALETVTIVVQLNGKMRDSFALDGKEADNKEVVEEQAKALPKINKYLSTQEVKKVIYIPGKILNFVI